TQRRGWLLDSFGSGRPSTAKACPVCTWRPRLDPGLLGPIRPARVPLAPPRFRDRSSQGRPPRSCAPECRSVPGSIRRTSPPCARGPHYAGPWWEAPTRSPRYEPSLHPPTLAPPRRSLLPWADRHGIIPARLAGDGPAYLRCHSEYE